ncbi:MAG: PAS domain-containing protein, partial [Gammaproteobacteria bacterium]
MPVDTTTEIEDIFLEAARALSSARPEHMYEDLVRAAVKLVNADIGLIGRYEDIDGVPHIRSLAWLVQGKLLPNEDYELAGTPCETVIGNTFKIYENRVGELFPATDALKYGINGYAAYPLQNERGEMLGLLSVMTYGSLKNERLCESVLRVFSERISHEILRSDADREIRARENYYRMLFDNSVDALVMMNSAGEVVDFNARLSELDPAPREELIGRPPPNFRSPEKYAEHLDQINRVLAGETLSAEYESQCADGTKKFIESRTVRIDYGGEPRVLRVIRDVGEKRERERALRESEERYREIFDASIDGFALLDDNGIVVDTNAALHRIDGFSREEVIGQLPPTFR